MTQTSCTRPDTTEPWPAMAMFPGLFYQHRAGGFSEGREQHIAHHTSQLPLAHVSVSVSVWQGDWYSAKISSQQLWPTGVLAKTHCCRPIAVDWGEMTAKTSSKHNLLFRSISRISLMSLNTKACRDRDVATLRDCQISCMLCELQTVTHLYALSHSLCPQNAWVFTPLTLSAQLLQRTHRGP